MKPDCYKCKYRGDVPGSAHSCCNHPSLARANDMPLAKIQATFASVGRAQPIMALIKKLNIKGNDYGISKGWFNFPWNFDPVWLENCDGYKKKK